MYSHSLSKWQAPRWVSGGAEGKALPVRFRFTPQAEAGCLSKSQLDEDAVLEPNQGRQ